MISSRDVPRLTWYKLKRWRVKREQQLAEHPLCAMCEAKGLVVAATVADHVEPHRGDYQKFWFGVLQSLCTPCHNKTKQELEHKGFTTEIGKDGWPVDVNHPANKI